MRRHDERNFTLFKRGDVYYAYYYDPTNVRRKISTHQKTKARAQAWVIEFLNSNSRTLHNIPYFKDYADKFFIEGTCPILKAHVDAGAHYSAVQASKYRSIIVNRLIPTLGKYRIDDMTQQICKAAVLKIREDNNLSPKTGNTIRSVLLQIMECAVDDGFIKENPVKRFRPFAEKKNERLAFTQDECRILFDDETLWGSPLSYWACALSSLTGMRLGEIRALRWDHIHDGFIFVEYAIADKEGLKYTKSDRTRVIPCPPIIDQIPHNSDEWCFSYDGQTWCSRNTIVNPLLERLEKCGIKNKTYHSFRHYFNTQLVGAGLSSDIVREVIGHTSPEMTSNYTHLETTDAQSVKEVQNKLLANTSLSTNDQNL
jgi:integrase